MRYRNENYHFPPSEPAIAILSRVLQGLKDTMNSIDGSIQLLKMGKIEEYEKFIEAAYSTILESLSTAFENMKFVVNAAHIYLEEAETK